MMRRARPASGHGLLFLLAGLAALACASDEDDRVTCLATDEECVDDARLQGAEVVLEDAEGNLVDRSGVVVENPSRATIPAEDPFWRLDAGETRVEGKIGFVGSGEGRLAVQLVSDDATNLLLVMLEDGGEERSPELVSLAFGRGDRCGLAVADSKFEVLLTSNDERWLAGRYAGDLICRDVSSVSVKGVFRVRIEGES